MIKYESQNVRTNPILCMDFLPILLGFMNRLYKFISFIRNRSSMTRIPNINFHSNNIYRKRCEHYRLTRLTCWVIKYFCFNYFCSCPIYSSKIPCNNSTMNMYCNPRSIYVFQHQSSKSIYVR